MKSGAVTRKEFRGRRTHGLRSKLWNSSWYMAEIQHIYSKRSVISPDRGLGILLVPGSLGIEAGSATTSTTSMARVISAQLGVSGRGGLVGQLLYTDACLRATISQNASLTSAFQSTSRCCFSLIVPSALFAIGYLVDTSV
jgi:hypothetical protein